MNHHSRMPVLSRRKRGVRTSHHELLRILYWGLPGYLYDDDFLIEDLKSVIAEFITSHKCLRLKKGYANDIWDYASGSFTDGEEAIDFEETTHEHLPSKMGYINQANDHEQRPDPLPCRPGKGLCHRAR
jgi:hypothetical protein